MIEASLLSHKPKWHQSSYLTQQEEISSFSQNVQTVPLNKVSKWHLFKYTGLFVKQPKPAIVFPHPNVRESGWGRSWGVVGVPSMGVELICCSWWCVCRLLFTVSDTLNSRCQSGHSFGAKQSVSRINANRLKNVTAKRKWRPLLLWCILNTCIWRLIFNWNLLLFTAQICLNECTYL